MCVCHLLPESRSVIFSAAKCKELVVRQYQLLAVLPLDSIWYSEVVDCGFIGVQASNE